MSTISTHNGTEVSREHNKRNPKVVSKEDHIKPNGEYEIWFDMSPIKAYEQLFGKDLEEYNNKQTRESRKIKSYYHHIVNDKNKHPVYEMIVGVYGNDVSAEQEKQIAKQFYDDWKNRNPNLFIVGAYWHRDEEGKNGHLHIDYIPVAHDCKRGLKTQNALVQAFNEMGFFTQNIKNTAQIQWERRENKYLEDLCISYGLTVEHPKKENQQHQDTKEYKQQKRIEEQQKTIEHQDDILKGQKNIIQQRQNTIQEQELEIYSQNAEIGHLHAQINELNKTITKLENELKTANYRFKRGVDMADKAIEHIDEERIRILNQARLDLQELRDDLNAQINDFSYYDDEIDYRSQ